MNNQQKLKSKPENHQNSRALVFQANSGGLANRLRAMVGYQALAEIQNLPFQLRWEQNAWCDAHFTDLFETPQINLINDQDWAAVQSYGNHLIFSEPIWFDSIYRQHASSLVSWPEFLKLATRKIDGLKPHLGMTTQVTAYLNKHDLSQFIGVHIRWTDNVKNNQQRQADASFVPENISRLEGFFSYVEDQLQKKPDSPVFIATDNFEVQKQFQDRFGDNVFFYPKTFTHSDRLTFPFIRKKIGFQRSTAVSEALVEMLLLSRCRTICGTYYSSFGKFSALLGDRDYYEVCGDSVVKDTFTNSLRFSQLSQNHHPGN